MDTEKLLNTILQDNEQTRRHFDDKAAEMGRHFDVVAESLKSEIRLVAEGVMGANERLDRHEAKLDAVDGRLTMVETKLDAFIVETRTNFDEVRASIKFSYAELDRRLTFLESGFKDLSSRMASLEGRQTH